MSRAEKVFRLVIGAALSIHAAALVTWVTVQVFGDTPPDIPGGTVAALGTVFGLPTVAYAVMQFRRRNA